MELRCYKNSADRIRVDKTDYLTLVDTLNGNFRGEVQLTHPIIVIEYPLAILNFNYIYIVDFNRYYYVSDINFIGKNLVELSLDIDILMSYKTTIGYLYGFIDRNEFEYDDTIIDDRRVIKNGYSTVYELAVPNNILGTTPTFTLSGFKLINN